MSLLQIFSTIFLVTALWRVAKWLLSPSSSLADVAGPEKEHWLKGNYHKIFQDGLDYNLQLTEKYGGAVKIHAMLGEEQLYVSDPRALQHIVVKEQHIYEETDMFIINSLMLNPVFSLANMRDLLPIIQPIADSLRGKLLSQLPPDGSAKEVNVLPWMSRAALEYICQAGLGYSFDALDPTKANEYTDAIRGLIPAAHRIILFRPFVPLVVKTLSPYWRNKLVDWLPMQPLKDLRQIVRVLDNASRKIFSEKRAGYQAQTGTEDNFGIDLGQRMKGKDIMSIMLKANASSSDADRLTDEELLGQMSTIIFAGFETTTTAICRILYILARQPEIQARLRTEIRKAKQAHALASHSPHSWEETELPYDTLMALPYLDAILRETLRVHPLPRTRQATTLPLQYPVRSVSGAEITAIPLRENTTIMISILAANHNKRIWGEDADVWKPERWLTSSGERIKFGKEVDETLGDGQGLSSGVDPEGTPGVKDGVKFPGVYASMMTFLGGGRACIGFKFAEMEMKQVLTTLLSTMHFALPSEVGENGQVKEIYWKYNGLQVPVIQPPAGDFRTPQVPLTLRPVRDSDFSSLV
ncbi:cytochrome P450 [Infundibulicybe gibba]|nr:cytochrome P450 [Infundibulicybe gibba]